MSIPLDLDEHRAFADWVTQAQERLPGPMQSIARDVILRIEDMPPEDLLKSMGINNPLELTGLYEGIPLTEKSAMDQPFGPDVIWLFVTPIRTEWQERGNVSLKELVQHVYIHELAHHFGWSDDDIAAIDPWWE